jgi:hypothetical protein
MDAEIVQTCLMYAARIGYELWIDCGAVESVWHGAIGIVSARVEQFDFDLVEMGWSISTPLRLPHPHGRKFSHPLLNLSRVQLPI